MKNNFLPLLLKLMIIGLVFSGTQAHSNSNLRNWNAAVKGLQAEVDKRAVLEGFELLLLYVKRLSHLSMNHKEPFPEKILKLRRDTLMTCRYLKSNLRASCFYEIYPQISPFMDTDTAGSVLSEAARAIPEANSYIFAHCLKAGDKKCVSKKFVNLSKKREKSLFDLYDLVRASFFLGLKKQTAKFLNQLGRMAKSKEAERREQAFLYYFSSRYMTGVLKKEADSKLYKEFENLVFANSSYQNSPLFQFRMSVLSRHIGGIATDSGAEPDMLKLKPLQMFWLVFENFSKSGFASKNRKAQLLQISANMKSDEIVKARKVLISTNKKQLKTLMNSLKKTPVFEYQYLLSQISRIHSNINIPEEK